MNLRFPLPLFVIGFLAVTAHLPGQSREGNTALNALTVLGPEFRNFVTKMSADSADPNPATWYLFALKGSTTGALYSFEVSGAEVTSERPSFNLGQLFSRPTPINLEKVVIDSPEAFELAREFSIKKGKSLGSVSFILIQEGDEATPVWQMWLYDLSGDYYAYLEISTATGEILSSDN